VHLPWLTDAPALAAWDEAAGRRRLLLLAGTPTPRRDATPIPRVILQTWKTQDLPADFAAWSATVRAQNPDYRHVLTDDATNRAFVAAEFPWFLPRYDAWPYGIQRADAVRYLWLFLHGGFYLDLDMECLKPLDRYLEAGDVVLGRMGPDPDFQHAIPNAAMASRPGQEFWLLVMARLLAGPVEGSPERTTGPVVLKAAVDAWRADRQGARAEAIALAERLTPDQRAAIRGTETLTLLAPQEWYPFAWNDPLHRLARRHVVRGILPPGEAARIFPRAGLITYWRGSWKDQVPGRKRPSLPAKVGAQRPAGTPAKPAKGPGPSSRNGAPAR
jgi:hypothetical protein